MKDKYYTILYRLSCLKFSLPSPLAGNAECPEEDNELAITMRATTIIMMKMGPMTTAQAATIVIAYLPSNLDKFSKSNSS